MLPWSRGASAEMAVIADAFNDYLQRNRSFVEREHALHRQCQP